MIRMYDKYFLNNVLFFGQEDNRESLRDRSRSQVVNRWQFVLDGKNEEGLDQSPCGMCKIPSVAARTARNVRARNFSTISLNCSRNILMLENLYTFLKS